MGDKCFGLGLQPKFLSAEEFEALLDEVVRTIINFGAEFYKSSNPYFVTLYHYCSVPNVML